MTITSAQWSDDTKTIMIVIKDGITMFVPNDTNNSDKKEVDTWLKAGNNILSAPTAKIVVPSSISDRQFFQQLAIEGIITQQEALAAVSTGTIPTELESLISKLPPDQQFSTRMIISGATTFERNNQLTITIGQLQGLTQVQMDELFIAAAKL